MKKSAKKNYFLIALLVALMALTWVGCFRVLGAQVHLLFDTNTDLHQILGRKPRFPAPTASSFILGKFQVKFEQATGDSIPFLERIIPIVTCWKSIVHTAWLNLFPESWSPVLPVGENDCVKIRGQERLFMAPNVFNPKKTQQQVRNVAYYYKKIAEKWPDVRFYIFAILRTEEMAVEAGVWPATPKHLLEGGEAVQQLRVLLQNSVSCDWIGRGRPATEVLNYYYNTDHHLTMPGGYEVYRQLHDLISTRGVNIGKVVEVKKWFSVPNVVFRGSRARLSGGYKRATDKLVDGVFVLPHYSVTVSSVTISHERDKRLEYRAGKVPTGLFSNHYTEYFGNDHGLVTYSVNEVLDKRNLLVIGDSFKNCMEPLLASHFQHSYFVDVRHFEKDVGYKFDLDSFISQNNITECHISR